MVQFVSDLRQVGGFCPGPPVSSTNKTDRHDISEILLKVALDTIKHRINVSDVLLICCIYYVLFWKAQCSVILICFLYNETL